MPNQATASAHVAIAGISHAAVTAKVARAPGKR